MSQQIYPIALKDTQFPLISEQQPKTIIGDSIGRNPDPDYKPGVHYCHNVMPSTNGLSSVGYDNVVTRTITLDPDNLAGNGEIVDVRVVYDNNRQRRHIAITNTRLVYMLMGNFWLDMAGSPLLVVGDTFDADDVTIGTVDGVSYIFFPIEGCFIIDGDTNTLIPTALTALAIPDIVGITGSYGYLIAFTKNAIAWSSTTNPTDFTPSQVTGAGGGNIAELEGNIVFATSMSEGIIIYTEANAVSGAYTGNVNFPFRFREIEGSKGVSRLGLVASEDNGASHFVYSKAGLQSINLQKAEVILPAVTDFLSGKRFEDFNDTTGEVETTDIPFNTTMAKKITLVGSRYLVMSYGLVAKTYTHALVADLALGRLGKLRYTHTDVIEYVANQNEIARESIALVDRTGLMRTVDFNTILSASGESSVLILGKLQGLRTRYLQVLGLDVDNVREEVINFSARIGSSHDGKNYTYEDMYLANAGTNVRNYLCRVSGHNHLIVLKGDFELVTAEVRYALAGRR